MGNREKPLHRAATAGTAAVIAAFTLTFGSASLLPATDTAHHQNHPTGVCTPRLHCTPSPSPQPTPGSTATPAPVSPSATAAATASPSATAAPTAPISPPSNSPPPAAGYLALRPVGAWSSLPSDADCAAAVHASTWEPRPENQQQNNSKPAAGAMAAAFAARPRAVGGSYNPLWDTWLLHRVDGQFTGTTDEIMQWAACKWGLPDNLIRADADIESTWFQYLHFANDGGSCYWDYGCGDSFDSVTSASQTYCRGIAQYGHDYQADVVTAAGGYPYKPASGLCPQTFSILGVMSWDNPDWQAPYPAWAGNQNGTFPFTRDSTAAAADYWGAYVRGCYEGWESWLSATGTRNYEAGDLWGCVGSWYDGAWHDSAAATYIAKVQQSENGRIWLTVSFDDSRQQYDCDPTYGCPR